MKNEYTRDEMVEMFGAGNIDKLERENCDFTNRVMESGDLVEFASSIEIEGKSDEYLLTAYYYQTQSALDWIDDLDDLGWEVCHFSYEVI